MSGNRFLLCAILTSLISISLACTKVYKDVDTDDEDQDNDSYAAEEDPLDYSWESSDVVYITLNGSSITIEGDGATADESVATINKSGTYSVSGTLDNGQLIVNSTDNEVVRILLNGVNISCQNSSPVYVKNAGKVVLITAENTNNYLADGTTYIFDDTENQEPNATLFSKSYISFSGNGTLVIDGNFGDGIVGKDGLVIKNGTINVSSVDDGIRGKDYIVVHGGNITINSGGDGLKSNNDSDNSLGCITIDSGIFSITSSGDAVSAVTSVRVNYAEMTIISGGGSGTGTSTQGYSGSTSAKGFKATTGIVINDGIISVSSADDAFHSAGEVAFNGGAITVSTMDDAVHAETSQSVSSGTLTVTKCYEGFEGPSITVSGGNVSIVSTDDTFNGTKGSRTESNDGSLVTISGGTVYINASTGDGLDSNGSASMSGGTVIINGPSSSPEVAIDINGSFNISGGLIIASGPNSGNMIEAPSTTSSQYSVLFTGSSGSQPGQPGTSQTVFSSSSLFNIQDADGIDLVTFKPVRNAYYIVFSSPELAANTTYYMYTGGTSSGTESGGLYTDGDYTGGTLKKTFTLTSKVTSLSVN